jgi:carboxylesterase type B
MALRWIHDHIASFGGDPARVTLFGESSGASSAGLHQMSSWSRDLFARAIYQSGSPDSHWSFMTRAMARRRSTVFFDAVGCSSAAADGVEDLLGCLRRLDVREIREKEWVQSDFMVFPWAPTVDGDFLTDTPYNLLMSGQFQHKEALLGVNRDEGTFWILFVLPGFTKDGPSRQNLSMYNGGVDIITWDLDTYQRQRIRERYLVDGGRDEDANRDALDKVCGDRSFTCPTKELTDAFSRHGLRTYFYYLTHRSTTEIWPPWMGVIHGADVQWVFGMPLNKSQGYTKAEVEFSKAIMSYWANFAKNGNPNDATLPTWPPYTSGRPQYLELRAPPNDFVVTTTFRDEYCHVWRDINRQIQEAASEGEDVGDDLF